MSLNNNNIVISFFTILISVCNIFADEIKINSSFVPSEIIKGQSVHYTITIEGFDGDNIDVEIPQIDGLKISESYSDSYSSNSFFSFSFNGRTMQSGSKTLSRSWQVKPTREGNFEMPSLIVSIDGKKFKIPATSLVVNKLSNQIKQAIFLHLDLPRDTFYAGESMKAILKLYYQKNRIQIQKITKPTKEGDSFAASEIPDKPNINQDNRNGIRYEVISWPFKLTALKAGKENLVFDLDVLIGRFMSANWLTVSTDENSQTILELPTDRPDSFNGAIGDFQTKVFASSNKTEVGEPITLTLEISGDGNFDRIAPPEIFESDDWKIYPPKSDFTNNDNLGLSGTKTIEYIIIPQNDSITQIPVIPFSFFDSKNNQYEELTMPGLPITVRPTPKGSPEIQAQSYTQNIETVVTSKKPERSNLLPIRHKSKEWISGPVFIFNQPLFLYFQAFPLFLISGLFLVRKRHLRLQNDSGFARKIEASKSVRKWLTVANKAKVKNEYHSFFEAAFRVIQESIGQHFSCSAETLTQPEMINYLKQGEISEQQINFINSICQINDSVKFSSSSLSSENLKDWDTKLNKFVVELNKFKKGAT